MITSSLSAAPKPRVMEFAVELVVKSEGRSLIPFTNTA